MRAGIRVIMCRSRYNSVKIGEDPAFPACAHPVVEQQIARGQWGFRGLLVSDCGAIFDEGPGNGGNSGHGWCAGGPNVTDVMQHCVAASLKAGTDLDCPGPAYFDYASGASKRSLVESPWSQFTSKCQRV
eukprot:COSAG01_NODE_7332_length_3247_cov_2.094663_1_plen_130_part_00